MPLSVLSVCIQKFKNTGLLAHESEINKLQTEGDRLVEMKNPGSAAIKACLSAMSHIGNCMILVINHHSS